MAQRFSIDAVFRAIDQITSPVRRMSANVSRSAERMERKLGKVNGALSKISAGARGVGRAVTAATVVAAAGLTHAVTVGADFEQTIIRAGAKFGGIRRGTKDFDDLAAAALAVSSKTEFMGTAAGGALEFMATAGESAAVAMGALGNFADFATANSAELNRAADIASDSIAALGLNLDELGNKIVDPIAKIAAYARTTDILTIAATEANLTLEDVFETTKKAGSTFRAAGQDVETFFAATQEISGVIKGADAGTALRIVMRNLLATTGEAGKAMRKLGVDAVDVATGKIKTLPDVLDEVKKELDKLSEGKRKRALSALFGRGEPAALALLANVEGLRKRIAVMADESVGKVNRLSSVMREGAQGAFKTLASTIETIEIEIFQLIRDDVVKITKSVTAWARANKDAFGEAVTGALDFMRDNFDKIVKIGPRILIFVGTLMALMKVLALIQAVMSILAVTTTITAGTMGIIALSVFALIAVLALAIIFWDDIVEAMETAWRFMADVFVGAIDALVGAWDDLLRGLEDGEALWVTTAIVIAALLSPVLGMIAGVVALAALGVILVENWDGIAAFFSEMWTEIVDSFFRSMVSITDKLDSMKKTFNEFVGSDVFDVEVKGTTTFEPIEVPPLPAANTIPIDVLPGPANGPPVDGLPGPATGLGGEGSLGFGGSFGGGEGGGPQVINTTSETLQRTIQESIRAVQVEVNLNAPPGVVESVERKGDDASVKVTASGGL